MKQEIQDCPYCRESPVSGAEIQGIHVCANHLAVWAMTGGEDIGEDVDYGYCELCSQRRIRGSGKAIGIAHDFNMRTKKDVQWHLCKSHMKDVGRLNLEPRDVKRMWKKHGVTFLTHDDYYDSNGFSCQPR